MAIRNYFSETIGPPPDGWQSGHVTLQLIHPDERVPVEAWVRGAFAIHGVVNSELVVITHVPSGKSVWTARDGRDATAIVEQIEPLTAWQTVKPDTKLRDRVREIINKIERERAA